MYVPIPAGLGLKRLTLSLTDDYDDVHYYCGIFYGMTGR